MSQTNHSAGTGEYVEVRSRGFPTSTLPLATLSVTFPQCEAACNNTVTCESFVMTSECELYAIQSSQESNLAVAPGSSIYDRYNPGDTYDCPAAMYYTSSSGVDVIGSCNALTDCLLGMQVAAPPTWTSDRQCAPCPAESYQNATNQPWCTGWSVCVPGEFVSVPPSSSGDRLCSPCEFESFQQGYNAASCDNATVCQPGAFITSNITSTTDRACQSCSQGTFSNSSNALECSVFTVCQYGSIEVGAPTASSDRICNVMSTTAAPASASTSTLVVAGRSTSTAVKAAIIAGSVIGFLLVVLIIAVIATWHHNKSIPPPRIVESLADYRGDADLPITTVDSAFLGPNVLSRTRHNPLMKSGTGTSGTIISFSLDVSGITRLHYSADMIIIP